MDRNERLHSVLRGKLNRPARRTKGYSKTDGMLVLSIALACEIRVYLTHMRVLGIPPALMC